MSPLVLGLQEGLTILVAVVYAFAAVGAWAFLTRARGASSLIRLCGTGFLLGASAYRWGVVYQINVAPDMAFHNTLAALFINVGMVALGFVALFGYVLDSLRRLHGRDRS